MNRIYVPSTGLGDWQNLLADPVKHWKPGNSAMLVAEAWQSTNGFPPLIADALDAASDPINSLQPLLILPEHQVPLPGGTANSQSDVWVLASHHFGLASISVEGKVSESFGPTLGEWLDPGASDGKHARLKYLLELLGLEVTPPDAIR